MTSQTLITLVVALLVLARVLWTQSSWRPLEPERAWRGPLLLAVLGAAGILSSDLGPLTPADLGVVLIEVAVSAAGGATMGTIATIRPLTEGTRARLAHRRRPPTTPVLLETRTGAPGILLWIGLLAVRIGLSAYSHSHGLALASASGLIALLLATNRAARSTVLLARTGGLPVLS
jgi:hypothetical protein